MTNTIDKNDSVTVAVIQAIANREGVDPVALPPLMDTIHVESLNKLVDSAESSSTRSKVEVTFEYYGYEVSITSGKDVSIEPLPD